MPRIAQGCRVVERDLKILVNVRDAWELWCASRPLYGNICWEGEWVHGRHWAAIDPVDPYADRFRAETVALDGWRVVRASRAEAEAWYRKLIKPDDGWTFEAIVGFYGWPHIIEQYEQAFWGKPLEEVLSGVLQ